MMENIFLHLLNMSLTAGILVVAVLLLRLVFYKAPRWIHVLLWALVAVRLLCPFTIESSLSLMPDTPAVSVPAPTPTPDTPPVENVVPDTPVVTPPVTDTPVVTPPVVTPPVTDTPIVDTPVVTPPVADTPDASLSAPTPEMSVDPWQIVLTVATYVWLVGVVVLAAYAVFTTLRLRRQVGEAAHLADNLWQCDHIRSPFILGVFRPRIYLPSDLSGAARDSVVAHEQAHLHRRDHWWKPLGFVLLAVYWFNPLMWVAYIFLCRDIEAACDERVVRDMPAADRKAYSEALLSCSAPRRLVSACPLAFGETSVKSRVKSVLSYKKPTIWIIVAALLVSTVAGVCLLTDPKSDDTDKPAVTDTDDDPDAEPQYAVFTHIQQPYAQVTLEIGGNRCTYTNSALSSAMLLEGTYEMGEDTVTMTFPDDAMTLLFDGDLTGLTLRIGKGGSLMSYEQMSFGDYMLKDGAVFERKDKIHAVSFTAPVTFAAGQVQMTDEQRNTLYNQYQYRTGNYSDKDRPIIPITSRAELDAFLDDYIIESKAELVSGYDDAFFTDKMLLAVYHRDSSGSLKPKIAAVMYNGTELVTVQVDVYEPSHVDLVTGHWFMLAEVPLAEVKGATAYRAVIRYRIPTENYWATYSHPVTVGGDEDVAFIGYYSLSEDSRETLLPLVEGLEWYSAEGGVDTGFSSIANFSFDGAKNYYLSPDKKQLYNGEQFANLTAEESEQLDYYLREGNPGEDAATASVTGTVVEWSKEGGYLVLEVTDSDSKLGSRVKVYTGILLPGSAPAVGYSATIYYDGWYDGNAIYAIDRKWQDADLLGGPDITSTDESLYDALLQSVVDYHLWLIPSAQEPDCSLMIGQHADLSELGIQLMDLDKNGQKELLISAMDWPDGVTPFVYDVYTIKDGKLVHLLSSMERSRYYLHGDSYIEHQWAGGAALSGTDFYRLVDGALTFVERVTYDADYAVESGLAADLSSVTEDVAWFHTTQAPGDSHKGYEHITAQQAKDIIADFTADHPLLNVNFLCLETGVAGSPEDDDPPTTGTTTTTKPTTNSTTGSTTRPTVQPSVPEVAAPSTDIATCAEGDYYYFVPPYQSYLYRRNLTIEDLSAPGALEKGMDFGECSNLRVSDGRVYYIKSGCLYSCRFDGTDTLLVDGDKTLLSYDIAGDWIFSVKKATINASQRETLYMYRKDGSQRKNLTSGKSYVHSYVKVYGFNRGKCYYRWEVSAYTGPDTPSGSDDLTYSAEGDYYMVDYRQSNPKAVTWEMKMPMGWHESLKERSLHNDYFSASVYGQYKFYNILTDEVVEATGGVGKRLNDYTVRKQNHYTFVTPYDEVGIPYLEFTDYTGKSTSVDLPISLTTTYEEAYLCAEQNWLGNMACVFQSNETTGDWRMILVGVDGSSCVLYTGSQNPA